MNTPDITPPAPSSDSDRGTIGAEQLQTIVQRALNSAAVSTNTMAGAAVKHAEREAAEREALDQWISEQRQIRAIKADIRAQRGAGNVAFGRGAAVVGGATLAGFLVGGPPGALVGAVIGWLADHSIGGDRP